MHMRKKKRLRRRTKPAARVKTKPDENIEKFLIGLRDVAIKILISVVSGTLSALISSAILNRWK